MRGPGLLEDRVTLVTGGASGIGFAIAERFAAEGARVAIASRSADIGTESAQRICAGGGDAFYLQADVTSESDVASMFAAVEHRYGPVTVLVNNAYSGTGDSFLDQDEDSWDQSIAGVLKGVYLCTRRAVPPMTRVGGGVIVNVSSVNALRFLGNDSYSASKAAMLSLTRATAVRLGRHGIRANSLVPGTIRTPAWEDLVARRPETLEEIAAFYPLGRIGEVDDCASAALFLASSQSSWITGTELVVDGGLLAGDSRLAQLAEG